MKKGYKIERYIDSSIKVGDFVKMIDGSALSCDKNNESEMFIVKAYPKLTGFQGTLKELNAEVVRVGITDNICMGVCGKVYLQDIEIRIGDTIFRTASRLVTKEE